LLHGSIDLAGLHFAYRSTWPSQTCCSADLGTMQDEYSKGRKLQLMTQNMLIQLENGDNTSHQLQGEISSNINNLERIINTLHGMVKDQPPSERDKWQRFVRNLAESGSELRESLEQFMIKNYESQRLIDEREQLFERRNRASATGDAYERRTSESLDHSLQAADEVLDTGAGILGQLDSQKQILKNVRRKMLDVTHSLGISKSLMGVIERRQTGDKWIVYGGMVFVTTTILLFYWFVLGKKH